MVAKRKAKKQQILNDQFFGDNKTDQYAEMKKQDKLNDYSLYYAGFLAGLKQGLHDGYSLTYDLIKKFYDDSPNLEDFNSIISNKEILHSELNKILNNCAIECVETGTENKLNLAMDLKI